MIKAVIFDCFGVLTTDHWLAFTDSLPKGPIVDRARELNHQYDAGILSRSEFVQQVHEVTGREPKMLDNLIRNDIVKNTKLLEYIKELKQTYKIGLLSNVATNWVRDSFLTTSEQALFDDMVFSYVVGVVKPNPKIYEVSLMHLGVNPSEAIFVDDLERYVAGANDLGMHGVVYQDFEQTRAAIEAILSAQSE